MPRQQATTSHHSLLGKVLDASRDLLSRFAGTWQSSSTKRTAYRLIDKYAIVFALVLFTLLLTILSPVFFSVENFYNIVRQVTVLGLLAIGETFVILTGEIDLSVGSLLAVTSVVTAKLLKAGVSIWLSVLIALLLGIILGLCTGVVITKLKAPSFIVSLAMMNIARGATLVITGGMQISMLPKAFRIIGRGYLWGIPIPVLLLLFVTLVAILITAKTRTGRYLYAIGGNRRAAYYCGVNPARYVVLAFAVSGLCCALGAVVDLSRIDAATAVSGEWYETQAISAVVIGGTYIFGGRGTILGTLIGVLFLGEIANSIVLLRVSLFYTQVFNGLVLIMALALDRLRRRLTSA